MVLYINDHIPKYVFMAPISLLRVRRAGTFMKVGGGGRRGAANVMPQVERVVSREGMPPAN